MTPVLRKSIESGAGRVSTWVKVPRPRDRDTKSIYVSMSSELYDLLVRLKDEREYPTMSSLVVRCCESYLNQRIKGGKT